MASLNGLLATIMQGTGARMGASAVASSLGSGYDRVSLLDPMTVIVTIASNAFKPIGTKLHIKDSNISLHDTSIMQGFVRSFYGDTKMDIKVLYNPILYACRFYMQRLSRPEIAYIFTKALVGLDNLKHTYVHDTETRSTIAVFYNVIHSCLEEKNAILPVAPMNVGFPLYEDSLDPGAIPSPRAGVATATTSTPTQKRKQPASEVVDTLLKLNMSSEARTSLTSNDLDEVVQLKGSLYVKMDSMWTDRRLMAVSYILMEMEQASPSGLGGLFQSLDSFIRALSEHTQNLVSHLLAVR
jgi:hypothetical protein